MKIYTLLLASVLATGSVGIAVAQEDGGRLAACRDDAQKYCGDKTGNDSRLCLQNSMSVLSEGCKQAVASMEPNAAGISSPTSDGTRTIPNSAGTYR